MEWIETRLAAVQALEHLGAGSVPVDEELSSMLEAIGQAAAAASVTLYERDAAGTLAVRASWSSEDCALLITQALLEQPSAQLMQCATEGMPLLATAQSGAALSMLYVPLRGSDQSRGVLCLARSDGTFSAVEVPLLAVLGSLVALTTARSAALVREAAARQRLEALNTLGRLITSSLDITEVFDTFAVAAQLLLRHDRLSAHVLAADGLVDELFAAAGDHTLSAFSLGERRPVESSLPARVALENQAFLTDDVLSDPRLANIQQLVVPRNARSWLSVPLRANGRAFGALNFSTRAPASYSAADIPLAQQIADQLATYLDLVRLHRQERDLAVAEERTRLAREIHDTLSQDLSLLVLQLQALERTAGLATAVQADIRAAMDQARAALEAARRSMWDLTPSPLEGRDLVTALEEELDRFCEATALRGRLTVLGEVRPLPNAAEVAAFRITQEALANARKHARARRITLRLRYEAAALLLSVEDDGRGFDSAAGTFASASGGFGLASMRERAHLLGGTLEVSSAVGRGTSVSARIPYGPRAVAPAPPAAHAALAAPAQRGPGGIRVLIADDHAVARHGIRRMLEAQRDIIVVAEAADGQEAVELAALERPDVVLLDLQMPRMDGIAALQQLRSLQPELGVVILTTYAQDERVFAALRDGARGYMLKDTSPEELAEAVRVVASGGSLLQRSVTTRLVGRLQRNSALTARELEVLQLVDEGLRSKEIAARLVVSERTVNFHLNNAYRKLEASGRTEALRIARTRGLLLS